MVNCEQTILIVDDNESARQTLEYMLDGQNYLLAFATNGKEALAKVAVLNPDLILLDVMMPEMDGFQVCQYLKAAEEWRHIPIILVTALNGEEDMVRGLDAGADDFLSKPLSSMELQARIRSMLRIKYQYDTLEKQRRELEATLHLNNKFSLAFAQQLEALEMLHDAGVRLMKHDLDTDSILSLIAQSVLDLIPVAGGCIVHFLAEDQHTLLPVVFSQGGHSKHIYPSLGIETIVRQSIEAEDVIYISDLSVEPLSPLPPLNGVRALLVTPLIDEQQPVGVLSVYSRRAGAFAKGDQQILSILSNQAAVAILKARFFKERELAKEREKLAMRDLFRRYVSPTVVDRLVDDMANLSLGGERQEVSVLFADIRGFTSFSEKLAPESLIEVLNEYLALAVEPILAEEGTLDKFMGDAVMALFNAPLVQSDHALRAIRAALAMQQAITSHNAGLVNRERLSFGIGIHVGEAVVGNIGTAQQMNYTAIGDTINLTKRLQENAQGGQILLSQAAYDVVKEVVKARNLGPLAVKGRTATEHVYELLGLRDVDQARQEETYSQTLVQEV